MFWLTRVVLLVDQPLATLSGVATAPVECNGIAAEFNQERFALSVPVSTGLNHLVVTDGTESKTVQVMRLITDRTHEDVAALMTALAQGDIGPENSKGAYNAADLNRVTLAAILLGAKLESYGFIDPVDYRVTDWDVTGIPSKEDSKKFLNNIQSTKATTPFPSPVCPDDLQHLTISDANAIEKILVVIDAALPLYDKSYLMCNEPQCGEFY